MEQPVAEYAPDLETILEELYTVDNPNILAHEVNKIDWKGIIKLYKTNDSDEEEEEMKPMSLKVGDVSDFNIDEFSEKFFIDEDIAKLKKRIAKLLVPYNDMISNARATKHGKINEEYVIRIIDALNRMLTNNGITYTKMVTEKNTTIDTLKSELSEYFNKVKKEDRYLYHLDINDTTSELKIDLTYTKLGYLIMLKSEILHDLSHFDMQILTYIDSELNGIIGSNRLLRSMLTNNTGLHRNYTEEIASELSLHLLNLKGIPRIVEKNGKTVLQYGEKVLGQGLFPSIYNKRITTITSDASNTANFEYSQISSQKLRNNTEVTHPLLHLDAGSGPSVIGFKEYIDRNIKLDKMANVAEPNYNKRVEINVYNPNNKPMVSISSETMKEYDITIFNKSGKLTETRKAAQLSITKVTEIVTSVSKDYWLNASILKSLGDLIPYLTVSLQTSMKSTSHNVNLLASRDYSMIFQALGDVRYNVDGIDNTDKLNAKKIIVGANFGNSNAYFPWSDREKEVYRIMHIILSKNIENYTEIRNSIYSKIQDVNCRNYKTHPTLGTYIQDNTREWLCNPRKGIANINRLQKTLKPGPDNSKTKELYENLKGLIAFYDKLDFTSIVNDTKTQLAGVDEEIEDILEYTLDDVDYCLANLIYTRLNEVPSELGARSNEDSVEEASSKKQKSHISGGKKRKTTRKSRRNAHRNHQKKRITMKTTKR